MIGYSAFLKLVLSWNNMTDAVKDSAEDTCIHHQNNNSV